MRRAFGFAALVTTALYVPFASKPLHIDDFSFVTLAQSIRLPWGHRAGVSLPHMGSIARDVSPFDSTHPPFVAYYLRLTTALTRSRATSILHASFLVFPLLLLTGVGHFARRLDAPVGPAIVAVGGSVAILPVGHTLMADLPAAALFTASAAAIDRSFAGGSRALRVAGATLALLSCLASYQMVLLLPLLALLARQSRPGSQSIRRLAFLALAALVLASVFVSVGLAAGGLNRLAGGLTQGLRLDWLGNRSLGVPVFLGTALAPLTALGFRSRLARTRIALLVASFVVFVFAFSWLGYSLGGRILLASLAAIGVTETVSILELGAREGASTAERFLAIWASVALAIAVLLLPFGAFRYLIPVVIPTSLLLLARSRRSSAAWLAASFAALIGLTAAIGDYQFAAAYPRFAREVQAEIGDSVPASRVWYAGDWGMKDAMGSRGFRYLTANSDEPQVGDLVILAEVARMWSPSPSLAPRLELIDVRESDPTWPIVLMSQRERAGYYSTLWGYYPFVLADRPIERFGIYRVVR